MIELNTTQIVLIVALVIVFISGIANQIRRNKQRKELENLSENNTSEETTTDISAEEKQAKEYIQGYKSQYSRDAIKQALSSTVPDETKLEVYLNKYY